MLHAGALQLLVQAGSHLVWAHVLHGLVQLLQTVANGTAPLNGPHRLCQLQPCLLFKVLWNLRLFCNKNQNQWFISLNSCHNLYTMKMQACNLCMAHTKLSQKKLACSQHQMSKHPFKTAKLYKVLVSQFFVIFSLFFSVSYDLKLLKFKKKTSYIHSQQKPASMNKADVERKWGVGVREGGGCGGWGVESTPFSSLIWGGKTEYQLSGLVKLSTACYQVPLDSYKKLVLALYHSITIAVSL